LKGRKRTKNKEKIRMKAKFETISTLALLLVFLLFSLPQETFAEEEYIYPVIETNCEQMNATAYRFQPGDTLNLTFTFQGPVYANYTKNRTQYHKLESIYNSGRFYWFYWFDGIGGPSHNEGYQDVGFEGYGCSRGSWQAGFPEAGEHTVKIVYLFTTYGDADGFYVINFHSERKLRLEEMNSPMPTLPVLISGVSGAAVAFAVSGVIWHKKNSAKKEENNVNP